MRGIVGVRGCCDWCGRRCRCRRDDNGYSDVAGCRRAVTPPFRGKAQGARCARHGFFLCGEGACGARGRQGRICGASAPRLASLRGLGSLRAKESLGACLATPRHDSRPVAASRAQQALDLPPGRVCPLQAWKLLRSSIARPRAAVAGRAHFRCGTTNRANVPWGGAREACLHAPLRGEPVVGTRRAWLFAALASALAVAE